MLNYRKRSLVLFKGFGGRRDEIVMTEISEADFSLGATWLDTIQTDQIMRKVKGKSYFSVMILSTMLSDP